MKTTMCAWCQNQLSDVDASCQHCGAMFQVESRTDSFALARSTPEVELAIQSRVGQALLSDLVGALESMPIRRLHVGSTKILSGEDDALSVLTRARGLGESLIESSDMCAIASALRAAPALVAEISAVNDCAMYKWKSVEICGPMRVFEQHSRTAHFCREHARLREMRWEYMRAWAVMNLESCLELVLEQSE